MQQQTHQFWYKDKLEGVIHSTIESALMYFVYDIDEAVRETLGGDETATQMGEVTKLRTAQRLERFEHLWKKNLHSLISSSSSPASTTTTLPGHVNATTAPTNTAAAMMKKMSSRKHWPQRPDRPSTTSTLPPLPEGGGFLASALADPQLRLLLNNMKDRAQNSPLIQSLNIEGNNNNLANLTFSSSSTSSSSLRDEERAFRHKLHSFSPSASLGTTNATTDLRHYRRNLRRLRGGGQQNNNNNSNNNSSNNNNYDAASSEYPGSDVSIFTLDDYIDEETGCVKRMKVKRGLDANPERGILKDCRKATAHVRQHMLVDEQIALAVDDDAEVDGNGHLAWVLDLSSSSKPSAGKLLPLKNDIGEDDDDDKIDDAFIDDQYMLTPEQVKNVDEWIRDFHEKHFSPRSTSIVTANKKKSGVPNKKTERKEQNKKKIASGNSSEKNVASRTGEAKKELKIIHLNGISWGANSQFVADYDVVRSYPRRIHEMVVERERRRELGIDCSDLPAFLSLREHQVFSNGHCFVKIAGVEGKDQEIFSRFDLTFTGVAAHF